MRFALAAITLITVTVGVPTARPSTGSCVMMMVLSVVFVTVAVIACIHTTGKVRTFWIGFGIPVAFAAVANAFAPVTFQFAYAVRLEEYLSHLLEFGAGQRSFVSTHAQAVVAGASLIP